MSSNSQSDFLFKKAIKYKKIIKKLRSELDIEKLKNQNCTCQNFPQHIFKDGGLFCIKVKNKMTSLVLSKNFSVHKKIPATKFVHSDLKGFLFKIL